jgi:hypothetical protein
LEHNLRHGKDKQPSKNVEWILIDH